MPAASVLRNVVLDEGPGRLLKCNKLARPARDRQRSWIRGKIRYFFSGLHHRCQVWSSCDYAKSTMSQNVMSKPAWKLQTCWNIRNVALTLMSALQVTQRYSITHNFFKTARTDSQQITLESWKVENTQLSKSILWHAALSIPTSINLSTVNSSVTWEWTFSKQEFYVHWAMVNRR